VNSLDFLGQGLAEAFRLILAGDPYVLSTTRVQLLVSGLATVLAAAVAIPAAVAIAMGRRPRVGMLRVLVNTAMGLPPVLVGLLVFIILTRQGPLGFLHLVYTPTAMILAQFILAAPIILGISLAALAVVPATVRDTALSLGGRTRDLARILIHEARGGILTAVLAGFGRVIAEVGAILIVGGNIARMMEAATGYHQISVTRTLTTAITVETRQGNIAPALALGIILLFIALLVNLGMAAWANVSERIPD